ncbi:hypothetical protein [Frateuria defendens]|uniref:hypothetical protein n=1 Tax=Frateuria defendens TaxID=2219559 RepID=UPI00301885B0
MPLAAAGQALGGGDAQTQAERLRAQAAGQPAGSGTATPLWRGADGSRLDLTATRQPADGLPQTGTPLAFPVVNGPEVFSSGVQYDGSDPRLQMHAQVNQHSWVDGHGTRVFGSEVGATYDTGRYSLGLSVGANSTPRSPTLPRVLPGAAPGPNGLADFDSSTQLNARGRLALDGRSGIDLGASVGRIRLLPGNALGLTSLDQKALSFGIDHGPLSGAIVGRTMQPTLPGGLNADRRWNSIDLGVTWRLPWQGSLSIGAQNLWSSGGSVNTPSGPEPDQSRTPYVQYHQDL